MQASLTSSTATAAATPRVVGSFASCSGHLVRGLCFVFFQCFVTIEIKNSTAALENRRIVPRREQERTETNSVDVN